MKKKIFRYVILMAMVLFFVLPSSVHVEAKAIYTGDAKIDAAVEAIIHRASGKKAKTNKQKLRACYNYLVKNMKFKRGKRKLKVKIKPTAEEKKMYKEALASLKASKNITYSKQFKRDFNRVLSMVGSCKHMSGVMCIIANHLGYKAGYCRGRYVRGNGSSCEHVWNWVKVDGKKKYCDVQAANCSWGLHHSQKAVDGFYMKSKNSRGWRKHHR